jgi:histidinol-phosphate aminotransferase
MTFPNPRPAVRRMAPYSPPTAGRADKLRLDFNENTVGCSPKVLQFLRTCLTPGQLAVYPEYGEAKTEVASFFGVAPESLLFTNGTDEAIQVIVNTYVDDGDEALLLRPSYAMYRFYAELSGAALREIDYLPETLAFPLEDLLRSVTPNTRAILIANPNNPTGTGIDAAGIERTLAAAPEAAVLIDEAYFEFCGITALPLLARYPNLFVSRTFSKVFGMAAMRLGCLMSHPANIAWLHKAQSPYSVNQLAVMAARVAVQDRDYIQNYVAEIRSALAMLREGLDRLGIGYYPSQGNFLLMKCGARAIEVRDRLRDTGVLVRDRSYELPGAVRVTAGTRPQIRRFLDELERFWQ